MEFANTESEAIAEQYEAWVYPQPVPDMADAVANKGYWDLSDPALFRRKLWPRNVEPDDLDILIAGCGANQAAYYALQNPGCRVVGVDLSRASLDHEAHLKEKHGLGNLELRHMSLGNVASLGRDFDLIVSTGVLPHTPEPEVGLRRLHDVLRPHGVVSVMVYGWYPRFGVYMLKDVFRLLGLRQDAAGLAMVKRTIQDLPSWHHARGYMRLAPDLGYDAGLVDTFLIPVDRAYTVPQVLEFLEQGGLKLQSWLDNVDYSISACIMDRQDPLRQRIETLPVADQWHLVELVAQSLANHRFLACHPERPEGDYAGDFAGDRWLDYVPSLRWPGRVAREADPGRTAPPAAGPGAGRERRPLARLLGRLTGTTHPPAADAAAGPGPLVLRRGWHASELSSLEAALAGKVDGVRSIREIVGAATAPDAHQEARSAARSFFRRMAEWDHFLYRIP
jgi:SAM-dependent methyltransferase